MLRQVLLVAAAAAAAATTGPRSSSAAAAAKAAAAATSSRSPSSPTAAAAMRNSSTSTTTTTTTSTTSATTTATGAPRDSHGRFTNPWPTWSGDKKLLEVLQFAREMRALQCPAYGYLSNNRNPTRADMLAAFPVHSPDYAGFEQAAKSARVAAIWAGHASVLVSIGGVNFLTDPVFADRASPVQWAGGPPRAVPPPVRIDDPSLRVDAVLISHNHYDHLCAPTVAALHARFGARLRWYVPLGLGAWLRRRGITNVTELDWWQSAAHSSSGGANGSSGSGSTTNTVTVTLTPAQHWSARGVFDRRKTLWGGFALSTNGGGGSGDNSGGGARFFFAGDSGYAPLFKEIGARLGPFDLAALPTGAYAPRGFMAPQHTDPAEAVRVHKDVGARRSVAIHCCTFHLTLEPLDEPPALLAREAAAARLAPDEFVTLQHGAGLAVGAGGAIVWPTATPLLTLPAAPAPAAAPERSAADAGGGGGGGGAEGVPAAFDKSEL